MHLKNKKILAIGDFLLDLYTFGEVNRISPEAPVPVLRVTSESRRPGGAGNSILNLISLGMQVTAVGRVGNDVGGSSFLQEMAKEGVDTRGIICDPTFQTPLKNRMIASGQQIVRIDYERPFPLSFALEQEVVSSLPRLLESVDLVAVSDYAKGFLTPSLLASLMHLSRQRNIPVIVDPKGIDFSRYAGATVIKPNYLEALGAAGLGMEANLDAVANHLLKTVDVKTLVITRSREGISVFTNAGSRQDYPAQVHEVKDVTGAGDTVLAILAATLANGWELSEAAHLANVAAGMAIERIGCARISLDDLRSRLALV